MRPTVCGLPGLALLVTLTAQGGEPAGSPAPAAAEPAAERLVDQGDLAGALTLYEDALAVLQRKSAGGPPALQRSLADTHLRIGELLARQGHWADALAHHRQAQRLSATLAAGGDRDAQLLEGQAGSLIADTEVALGEPGAALDAYRGALGVLQILVAAQPDNQEAAYGLAVTHGRLADTLASQGRTEEALQEYDTGRRIADAHLATDPQVRWQRALLDTDRKVGDLLVDLGHAGTALQVYQPLAGILGKLAAVENEWRADQAYVQLRIGEVLSGLKRFEEALTSERAAQETLKGLAAASAGKRPAAMASDLISAWAASQAGIARAQLGQADGGHGHEEADNGCQTPLKAAAAYSPTALPWTLALAQACNALGGRLAAAGETAGAERAYRVSLSAAQAAAAAGPGSASLRHSIAVVDLNLANLLKDLPGRGEEALAGFAAAQSLLAGLPQGKGVRMDWAHDQVVAEVNTADSQAALKHPDAARQGYLAANQHLQALTARPTAPAGWQSELLITDLKLGTLEGSPAAQRRVWLTAALALAGQLGKAGTLAPEQQDWPEKIRQRLQALDNAP